MLLVYKDAEEKEIGVAFVSDNDAEFCDITENEDVIRMLDACATVCESINSLRGFYLDRTLNMIGNTGWDLLDNLINGEDWIQKAFDRHKDISV